MFIRDSGPTRRGIAPVYGDKYMKKAVRMGELLEPEYLEKRLDGILEWKNLTIQKVYGAEAVTKESLLYRELFEAYYPGQAKMVKDFWMPNRSWEGCDVDDPSARVLANYGASGF